MFSHNHCFSKASIYLLWLHYLWIFSLKFNCLQRPFLNEKIDNSSWKVEDNWQRLFRNGAVEVSFQSRRVQMPVLFQIFTCAFLSCVISLIDLPPLPSSSSAVLIKPSINTTTTSVCSSMPSRMNWECYLYNKREILKY